MKDCVPSFENYRRKFPELNENIDCVEEYLTSYDLFTQDPDNRSLVNRLYEETLKMINNAIETRFLQGQIATRQMNQIMNNLVKKYPDSFAITGQGKKKRLIYNVKVWDTLTDNEKQSVILVDDLMENLNDVIRETTDFLKARKDLCLNPETPKFLCIESFASSAHFKGPYIPLGCGLPYPEFRDVLSEEEDLPVNVLGGYMADETRDSLDCIFKRR